MNIDVCSLRIQDFDFHYSNINDLVLIYKYSLFYLAIWTRTSSPTTTATTTNNSCCSRWPASGSNNSANPTWTVCINPVLWKFNAILNNILVTVVFVYWKRKQEYLWKTAELRQPNPWQTLLLNVVYVL